MSCDNNEVTKFHIDPIKEQMIKMSDEDPFKCIEAVGSTISMGECDDTFSS